MLAFLPIVRITQPDAFGEPIIVHHDEGVIGYHVGFAPGQDTALDADDDADWKGWRARQSAAADICRFAGISRFADGTDGMIRDTLIFLADGGKGPPITIEQAIATERAVVLWYHERRDAWHAEMAEEWARGV